MVEQADELHHHSQQAERIQLASVVVAEVALAALEVQTVALAAHVVFQELTLVMAAEAQPLAATETLEDVAEAQGGHTQVQHLAAAVPKADLAAVHKTTQAAGMLMVVAAEAAV